MAIKIKRSSSTEGKVPTIQLSLGEIAINTYDGRYSLKRTMVLYHTTHCNYWFHNYSSVSIVGNWQ